MIWCGAVLLALCFSGSFSHVIVIEETANGTVLHRHLNSHDLCAALGGLQSGSDGNKIVSKTKAENYQIPADKVSHDTRSIVGPSCRGRTRELLRMTLREVTRWAAVATLATFFRREGRFDVYNSRAFSACFPFVGPALRWRVRARFDAVSVEASMADTGVVTLRCDDPGHCCSADPSRLALVLEEADEIILVLAAAPCTILAQLTNFFSADHFFNGGWSVITFYFNRELSSSLVS